MQNPIVIITVLCSLNYYTIILSIAETYKITFLQRLLVIWVP